MNYVIAVVGDRTQAEAAYSALEKENLPSAAMSIVGKGYKTTDEFGFIDPNKEGKKQATIMSFWLVPFGFIGGYAFNLSTQYMLVPVLGVLGNHILGGLFGAIAGAMGSFVVGGGVGIGLGGGDALPYRNRLRAGKYLVVVKGAPNLTNKATRILKQFEPENIQGYVDPME
ncbi:MAG: hypothetical protein WBA57_22470 [Elainellaceae cyanobacterium]